MHIGKHSFARLLAALLAAGADPALADRYNFRVFGDRDGLENPIVRQVAQDKRGYLWVVTSHGLYRFDGVRFEFVRDFAEWDLRWAEAAPDGSMWYRAESGVYRIAPGAAPERVISEDPIGSFESSPLQTIAAGANGEIWTITKQGLRLERLAPGRDTPFRREVVRETAETNWSVLVRKDGSVMVGCGSAICEYRDGRWSSWNVPQDRYLFLGELRDGTLVARGRVKLVLRRPGADQAEDITGSLPPVTDNRSMPVAALDFHRRILANHDDGVYRQISGQWQRVSDGEGLSDLVRHVFVDRDGGIWLSTANGLLRWLGDGAWTLLGVADGLPRKGLDAVAQGPGDAVWASSVAAGLYRGARTEGRWRFSKIEGVPPPRAMIPSWEDTSVWLGPGEGGVSRYAGGRVIPVEGVPPDVRVSEFSMDGERRVIAATSAGVYRQDGPNRMRLLWRSPPVFTVGWAPNGDFWFGLQNGIARLRGDEVVRISTSDRIEERGVRAIYGDSEERIWIGTWRFDGLKAYRQSGSTLVAEATPANPGATTFFVHLDREKGIWSGSTKGLVSYRRGRWYRYGRDNGLNSDQCASACFLRDRSIWFATQGGLARYDPPVDSPPAEPPLVEIGAMRRDSEAVPMIGQLELPAETREVSFDISVLSTVLDSPPGVRYRLHPGDPWAPVEGRTLRFRNIRPGSHRLEVQAQGLGGEWSASPARFPFRVAAPWWATWWFRGTAGALTAAAVGLVWRMRLHSVQNANLRRIRDMFDRYPGAAWIVADDGRFLMVNETMARYLGRPRSAIEGRPMSSCLRPETAAIFESNWKRIRAGGDQARYVEEHKVRGSRMTFDVLAFPLRDASGKIENWCVLANDITEKRALEKERERTIGELAAANQRLSESESQLRALAARNQRLVEEERVKLAREIHDVLGQQLTAIKIGATRLRNLLAAGGPPAPAASAVSEIAELTDETARAVRRLATELRPPGLESLGLAPAIRWHAKECAERIGIPIECDIEDLRLSPDLEITLFRLVQESLTNVSRYASASFAEVRLIRRNGTVQLTVTDDGVGFDASKPAGSLGLLGMKERAIAAGGALEIVSSPGHGTTVSASIPVPGASEVAAEAAGGNP